MQPLSHNAGGWSMRGREFMSFGAGRGREWVNSRHTTCKKSTDILLSFWVPDMWCTLALQVWQYGRVRSWWALRAAVPCINSKMTKCSVSLMFHTTALNLQGHPFMSKRRKHLRLCRLPIIPPSTLNLIYIFKIHHAFILCCRSGCCLDMTRGSWPVKSFLWLCKQTNLYNPLSQLVQYPYYSCEEVITD